MSQYFETIKEYILAAKNAHTHAGKMVAFSELLKSIFGVSSYEIVQNIEQYVKTGGLMRLKGRMDMRALIPPNQKHKTCPTNARSQENREYRPLYATAKL